ncbi:MAG TPA: glycosyl transferase [Candidatus Accumulibacter sp.]|nr:glycosyl transferase [Accumulibacter sp.]
MASAHRARVVVITRTKNRPVMLRRAMASVSHQSFRDFTWVIVNDGGDAAEVEAIATSARQEQLEVQTIHNAQSLGMEAASNCAIRASDSELLVIHDDDDTWDPQFLAATAAFLATESAYGGVVTHTNRVDEVIEGDLIRVIRTTPWNHDLMSVYLIEMAQVNSFPPISFLFRRSVLAEIGMFDESLPVLGDWDFHLRFLAARDIGVVPRPLAFYHHRETSTGVYGNSLYDGISKHIRYDALLRNRLLRRDLEEGRLGLGMLVNLARTHNGLSMLEMLMHTVRRIGMKTGLLKLGRWLAR